MREHVFPIVILFVGVGFYAVDSYQIDIAPKHSNTAINEVNQPSIPNFSENAHKEISEEIASKQVSQVIQQPVQQPKIEEKKSTAIRTVDDIKFDIEMEELRKNNEREKKRMDGAKEKISEYKVSHPNESCLFDIYGDPTSCTKRQALVVPPKKYVAPAEDDRASCRENVKKCLNDGHQNIIGMGLSGSAYQSAVMAVDRQCRKKYEPC